MNTLTVVVDESRPSRNYAALHDILRDLERSDVEGVDMRITASSNDLAFLLRVERPNGAWRLVMDKGGPPASAILVNAIVRETGLPRLAVRDALSLACAARVKLQEVDAGNVEISLYGAGERLGILSGIVDTLIAIGVRPDMIYGYMNAKGKEKE